MRRYVIGVGYEYSDSDGVLLYYRGGAAAHSKYFNGNIVYLRNIISYTHIIEQSTDGGNNKY